MGKRNRKRSVSVSAGAGAVMGRGGIGVPPSDGLPIAWMSGYDGANWSNARGMTWWPSLDPRQELDSFSRTELLRRIHWLKANFGFIRGIIRNTAEMVGSQTPQAQSGDDVWDDLAEEAFRDKTGESEAFDVAGKFDFEEAQPMLVREGMTDGDVITVMTKWEDGSARFMFYKTSQLANPKDAGPAWRDGIKYGKTGRMLAYGVRTGEKGAVEVIPASAVIYYGEFDAPGEDRPVPPLSAAINHSTDITETWGFLKSAVKASSLMGIVREQTAGTQQASMRGLPGAVQTVTDSAGNEFNVAQVWDGAQMPMLPPGVSTKILTDGRPHPNVQEWITTLMRDVAEGFGLPLEVVWHLVKLTGPGIRFVMSRASRWIKQRQKRQRKWARKVWRYVIACEIARGALRLPNADKNGKQRWWDVSFTAPADMTIDEGQVTRAKMEKLDRGVATWSDFEELDGRNWKDRVKQRVAEVKLAREECEKAGLTYEQVFPPRQGAAVPAGDAEEPAGGKKKAGDDDEED